MQKILLLLFASLSFSFLKASVDNTSGQKEALSTFSKLDKSDLWVNSFSDEKIKVLPVGLKHTLGNNIQVALGIFKATLYPEYTELTVFGRIRLPQTDGTGKPFELFFGAEKIKMSHDGGIIGDAHLVLLGDVNIPFNGNKWMLTLKGGGDYKTGKIEHITYATFDCDGMKELGLAGAVEFSRDLIIPIESSGEVDENKTTITVQQQTETGVYTKKDYPYRVKGEFEATISDWNDMLFDVNLQPFVMSKKRNGQNYDGNFQFYINKAKLDFSDLRNNSEVQFPIFYSENGLLLPNANTWRGVYIQTLEVHLPKEFVTTETAKNKKRVSFGAHDLIIDNYGVSGKFYADNLIPLNKGITNDKKGWAYSVDHIGVDLAANTFIKADFNGKIILPVSKQDSKMGLSYNGLITQDEYLLKVKNDSVINFNIWKAKGKLEPNSYVEFKVKEGKFRPKAVLNGHLNISASQDVGSDKDLVAFEGIKFQNLVLQTESPIFSADYFGYQNTGTRKMSNFPVTISEIGITANESAANLYFGIAVNLMGNESKNGFSGTTRISVLGKFEESDGKQKWVYHGLKINRIALDASLGSVKLKGFLDIMDDDPEYGNGFNAHMEGTFGSFGPVSCNAIFGSTDFRYWMVDGAIQGLNIGTGIINLSGFAGGASYHMLRKPSGSSHFAPTGLGYTPNKNTGLGVKAMVNLNIGNEKAINGGAGFEIIFNTHGGVNQMGFYGEVQVMKAPGIMKNIDKLTGKLNTAVSNFNKLQGSVMSNVNNSQIGQSLSDKPLLSVIDKNDGDLLKTAQSDYPSEIVKENQAMISAYLGIQHDFVNKTFHAELEVFVNVAGVITGRGPNNRAAKGVIHIAPDEWYTYLGRPSDRAGLRVGIGSIGINAGGYFMAGDRLEGSPPPPPIVAEILGVDAEQLNYMRDENALSAGRGFAFGQDFSLDTGDLRFLILYARFQAGGGFDIMLRDYGAAQCMNTNEQVGINGWYANGQSYAYLQGELGIRIKLFLVKLKIPIIKAGAAILFQTKAPNPFWMRGYLGGHYNLLGGLIKGSFRFKMTLGKECEFADQYPLGGIKIIADVSPDNGSESDVFTIPQATFAMKVEQDVVLPEDDGDKTYKISLDKFIVLDNDGKEVEGRMEWNEFKDRASFISKEILPPNTNLKAEVEVSFLEKINGVYRPVTVDGKTAKEREVREFTTGGAPDVIPLQNIQYAYPILDQRYFFTDEYDKGYIQLKRGQSYLFDDTQWKSTLTLTDESNKVTSVDFNYDKDGNRLSYTLPKILQSKKYEFSIISKLKEANTTSEKAEAKYQAIETGDSDNTLLVQQNKAEILSKNGEIERLNYKFATSYYKNFKSKIKSISVSEYNLNKIYSDVISLSNRIKEHEAFDLTELTGTTYTERIPTVTAEAILDDNYFMKDINPALYSKYPLDGRYYLKGRDGNDLGVPPTKALPIFNHYITYTEHDVNKNITKTTFPYYYNLPYYYKLDWIDIQNQIVNDYVNGTLPKSNKALEFLDESYKFMREGYYKIKLKYRLPGGIEGSQETINYKNSIK